MWIRSGAAICLVLGSAFSQATCPDWCRVDYLEYYLDRTLEEVEENVAVYEKYFKGENWNIFDIEQVVLIEDTLHICLY